MSSNPQQPPASREIVFCHACENEWYRDEHGIVCPECQGDFCEVIEENNDPREEPPPDPRDFYAPDPDEDDIDNLRFHPNGPGQPAGGRYQGTFARNFTYTPGQGFQAAGGQAGDGGGPGLGGGLLGMLAPALQQLLGGQQQQQQGHAQAHAQGQPDQQRQPGQESEQGIPGEQRAQSPQQGQQQQPGGGQTWTRHASGPNYSFTITTSSNAHIHPRDAHGPQPLQGQPDNLERMMAQMFSNIGVARGHGGMRGVPIFVDGGMVMADDDDDGMPMHGGPMGGGAFRLGPLLQMLGMPPGGVHGDAVYSQEALDRIISQLMEQHQSGHAPGPASAEAIEKLPKRPVTEKDTEGDGKANCSICMDEAALGSMVTELPCSHWFHHDCIKAWLNEHDTCPHCRQGIMPKEGDGSNTEPRQPSQAPLHDIHSPEYQRSRVPGEYPFPRQGSASAPSGGGDGSRTNPFAVPESPDARRSASPRAERSGGMFSRMREAFSPREQPPSGGPSSSGDDRRGA